MVHGPFGEATAIRVRVRVRVRVSLRGGDSDSNPGGKYIDALHRCDEIEPLHPTLETLLGDRQRDHQMGRGALLGTLPGEVVD